MVAYGFATASGILGAALLSPLSPEIERDKNWHPVRNSLTFFHCWVESQLIRRLKSLLIQSIRESTRYRHPLDESVRTDKNSSCHYVESLFLRACSVYRGCTLFSGVGFVSTLIAGTLAKPPSRGSTIGPPDPEPAEGGLGTPVGKPVTAYPRLASVA